jgi:hypothetical protein
MRLLSVGLVGTVGLLLLAILPAAGAAAPVSGTVTSCSGLYTCKFVFNTSAGTGWATGLGSGYTTPGVISFQLPGEARATSNVTYHTYIGSLIGTYTYWVEGNFLGTDVNSGHVVYGTTNTNYTITCHGHSGRGGGCTYTYTTDNGTIVVQLTKAEQTSTNLTCAKISGKTACSLSVINLWNGSNIPTGKVLFTGPYGGKLSNNGTCKLSSKGTCSFTFRPPANPCGIYDFTANYLGTTLFYKSSGSTTMFYGGGC